MTLAQLGRYDEAVVSYSRSIDLDPGFSEAFNNRGSALAEMKHFDEAVTNFDQAIALRSDYAEPLYNRGNLLSQLGHFDEAVVYYDRAIARNPDNVAAFNNRGSALGELKRFDEAIASFERAAAIRPGDGSAQFNEAVFRLLVGDFDHGWPKYEWRWKSAHLHSPQSFPKPQWYGREDIAGKTILLHAEQGRGRYPSRPGIKPREPQRVDLRGRAKELGLAVAVEVV